MREFKTRIGRDGSITIPEEHRRRLDLRIGDVVIMRPDNGGLRLYTPAQAVARAQSLVRLYIPEDRDLAEELISERRTDASL